MKKTYLDPEVEFISLIPIDILTNSGNDGIVDDSDEPFMGGDIIIIN